MRETPRLWDALHFRGADWQVVADRDGCFALSPLLTGRPVVVAGAELLLEPDYRLFRRGAATRLDRVDLLGMVPARTRSRALFLQRHVVEALTGTPPDAPEGSRPRAEFDPAGSLRSRVEAKARELEEVGFELSGRSLWRYVTRYRLEGVKGLIDLRGQRTSASRSISPKLVAIAEDVLCRQTHRSTGTRSRAFASIEQAAADQGVEVPSRATVYRLLSRLDRQRHSFGNATTRRTQANRPDRAYGQQAPSRPGELVEIDSTPLDVMVLYPDGGSGRVDLTLALDVATRTILAAVLSPVAAKAVDAALLLARAMTPLPAQPGWVDAVRFSRSLLPEGALAEPEVLATGLRERPGVSIESVTIDRGRVFVSSTFMAACERLKLLVVKAEPRTPTDKPHVERMFG